MSRPDRGGASLRAVLALPHARGLLIAGALARLPYGLLPLPLLLGGAAADCVLITAYLLVEELVPAGARAEGGAWVNTAFNLGGAGGSGLAGLLAATAGVRGVFVAGALLVAAVTVLLALRRGSQRPEPAGVVTGLTAERA